MVPYSQNIYGYPYSVILKGSDIQAQSGQLLNNSESGILENYNISRFQRIIDGVISKLQRIINNQRNIYKEIQGMENGNGAQLLDDILHNRNITVDENGNIKGIAQTYEEMLIEDLEKREAILKEMDDYKVQYNKIIDRINTALKKVNVKDLNPSTLYNTISKIKINNDKQRGIQKQMLTLLKDENNANSFSKLFLKSGTLSNDNLRKQYAILIKDYNDALKKHQQAITNDNFQQIIGIDLKTNLQQLADDLAKVYDVKSDELQEVLIDYLQTNIDTPAELLSPQNYTFIVPRKAKSFEAVEYTASLSTPILTHNELKNTIISAARTGAVADRISSQIRCYIKFKDQKALTLISRERYNEIIQGALKLDKEIEYLTLDTVTTHVSNKTDDIITIINKDSKNENKKYNLKFSDKLIFNETYNGAGGLANVKMEGGTLYSLINLLKNNNLGSDNFEELIFTILNMSSVSKLSGTLSTIEIGNFVKALLISEIYTLAFNPESFIVDLETLDERNLYFHHIDTMILPSYNLLEKTISQLEGIKESLLTSEGIQNNYIKASITPSTSYTASQLYTQYVNTPNFQNDPAGHWRIVADLIASDTAISVMLDIPAILGSVAGK